MQTPDSTDEDDGRYINSHRCFVLFFRALTGVTVDVIIILILYTHSKEMLLTARKKYSHRCSLDYCGGPGICETNVHAYP